MRNVKSLFHINFPTQKWDEMVDFYVNVCGFDQAFVIYSADMKKMFGQEVLPGDDKLPQITYIRVSPNSYIELWNAGLEKERKIHKEPNSPFHHFALLTEDLERTCLEPFTPYMGEDGCLIAWMEDPDGHYIEVMQLSGRSLQEQFEKANPICD